MSNNGMLRKCPPWEVLTLVAATLEPKSLGLATCVSKSWYESLSIDQFWEPLCILHFPAFATIHLADPSISCHGLYSLFRAFAARRRRIRRFPQPPLNLYFNNLIFTITAQVRNPVVDPKKGREFVSAVATVKRQLEPALENGMWFDLEIIDGAWVSRESLKREVRVTWNVTLEGYGSIFTMLDCKDSVVPEDVNSTWMFNELPLTRCGFFEVPASGLVAGLKLGMQEEDGKVKIVKVGVGMLNVMNWRYVGLKDGLEYLNHFLSI